MGIAELCTFSILFDLYLTCIRCSVYVCFVKLSPRSNFTPIFDIVRNRKELVGAWRAEGDEKRGKEIIISNTAPRGALLFNFCVRMPICHI